MAVATPRSYRRSMNCVLCPLALTGSPFVAYYAKSELAVPIERSLPLASLSLFGFLECVFELKGFPAESSQFTYAIKTIKQG